MRSGSTRSHAAWTRNDALEYATARTDGDVRPPSACECAARVAAVLSRCGTSVRNPGRQAQSLRHTAMTSFSTATHSLVLTIVIAVLSLRASASPDDPRGMVFYEVGGTTARTSFGLAVVLKEGGVFDGLYRTSTEIAPAPQTVTNAEDGTWTYRKVSEQVAELTLRTASGSGPFAGTRTLQFTSETAGTTTHSDFAVGQFRFVAKASPVPLTNCSNRSFVRSGSAVFTGFVIGEAAPRAVLIRAVGPGLVPFGVTGWLKTPRIAVRSGDRVVASRGGWADELGSSTDASIAITRTSALVGAFALPAGSKDAATIVTLGAGPYVAEVTSADPTDSGEVLVEVYVLP